MAPVALVCMCDLHPALLEPLFPRLQKARHLILFAPWWDVMALHGHRSQTVLSFKIIRKFAEATTTLGIGESCI